MGTNILQIPELNDSNSEDQMHIERNGQDYRIKTSLIASTVINENTSGNWVKGGVIWSQAFLQYIVYVNECSINGIVYNQYVSGGVTLSDGDDTFDRIDVFTVNVEVGSGGTVLTLGKVDGIPSANPLYPNLDIITQAEVGFRITSANETVDTTTQIEMVYDENTGESAEWDNTLLPSGANLDYATNPYKGSKCVFIPQTNNSVISWTNDSLITLNNDDSLIFALRGLQSSKSHRLQIKLIDSSTGYYYLYTLRNLSSSDWGLQQIKLSEFQRNSKSQTQYDRLEITFISTSDLSLDWVHFQSELPQNQEVNILPYKHLSGLIFQTATGNPTFLIGYNDLGFEPNFIRQSAGIYEWDTTSLGVVDEKTFGSISPGTDLGKISMRKDYASNPEIIRLKSYYYSAPNFTLGDSVINGQWFEFRIYN